MRKILVGLSVLLGLVLLVVVGFVGLTKVKYAQPIDAPYPEVVLSTDPEVLSRGEYLVWNVVGCDKCHLPHDQAIGRPVDARPDLSGGWVMSAPGIGTMEFPNITPHPQHGIGRYEPREVARVLRSGVLPDGTLGMTMAGVVGDMSDADLTAIVSYIYSRPAVDHATAPPQMTVLYEALLVWVLGNEVLKVDVADPAPASAPTLERGAYLALGPAGCVGCHSPRDGWMQLVQGEYFGGSSMVLDAQDGSDMVMCAPNLTPDPGTGHITQWTEEQFIARMRAGRVFQGSSMPWESFAGLSDDDLHALWAFLERLDPVEHETGAPYRPRG